MANKTILNSVKNVSDCENHMDTGGLSPKIKAPNGDYTMSHSRAQAPNIIPNPKECKG